MTRIAYRTDGVPQWGTCAFTPIPAMTGSAATGGEQKRYLAQWSPTPNPQQKAYATGPPYDAAQQGSFADPPAGLNAAFTPHVPDVTHGMRYWATADNMGPNGTNTHMAIFSDNVVPVPAVNPGRVAMPAMVQPPFGTVIATAWPRPYITWPTWGSSRQA